MAIKRQVFIISKLDKTTNKEYYFSDFYGEGDFENGKYEYGLEKWIDELKIEGNNYDGIRFFESNEFAEAMSYFNALDKKDENLSFSVTLYEIDNWKLKPIKLFYSTDME